MDKDNVIKVAVIGVGNRANKYLHYVKLHPEEVQLVAIVDPNSTRTQNVAKEFGLESAAVFTNYNDFFQMRRDVDAVFITTPDHLHYDPCCKAIHAGYHVLLEKPIAQTLQECEEIAQLAAEKGVMVGVCHILRYHPYFMKVKQLVDSGELGRIIAINHAEMVGLDRTTHSYVRGPYRRQSDSNPMIIAKCSHDIDYLLWLTSAHCTKVSSFGNLCWFRKENAPKGSAARCVDCKVEHSCPYSAVNLYQRRRQWIANFDVPDGKTLDQVIEEELNQGQYGRCVYHCDNDVVDQQVVAMEMDNHVVINFTMDTFTLEDCRRTRIQLSMGELDANEEEISVRYFKDGRREVFKFDKVFEQPYHAGADLNIVEDFVGALRRGDKLIRSSIADSLESHLICFKAEQSRLTGETYHF